MPPKKRTKTTFKKFVPTTHFSPFNNLTNNLSLQQHQNSTTLPFAENETINHIDPLTPNEVRYPVYMDPLNDTTRYPITLQPSQPSLITHHVTHNQENQSPFNSVAINNQSPIQSTSTFINFNTPKSTNRWTTSETRMLIEEVRMQWQALQQVKDPREKGQIWDKIITNIQKSDMASPSLKERTKTSVQQKWDALLQKFRDIKDKIESTGGEATQNDWEFFKDMDSFLRKDPSIVAPITSDSIYGIKRKEQKNAEEQVEENDSRQQKKARSEEKKTNIEEIRTLIKEQTDTIAEIMKEQYIHASEVQQKQHNEQMELFKMFLTKF
ncbi:unnamed protein product [Rhizophagus irregularis]|nr:unnamed protein product [Rhizophagus irregularis]